MGTSVQKMRLTCKKTSLKYRFNEERSKIKEWKRIVVQMKKRHTI